jgi:divalent metal cation (Fe/Co/Zn/Cd) transporter
MEEETNFEVTTITEMPPQQPSEQFCQPPQPQKFTIGQAFVNNYAKAGKAMLRAAIAQCVLIALMYLIGYAFGNSSVPLSSLMDNELDIDIEPLTLALTGIIMLWTSILLIPSAVFMFCYAVSAKKAANGNSKALLRSARHIKTFFLVSGIVIMVAVFLAMILVVTGINSADTTIVFNY